MKSLPIRTSTLAGLVVVYACIRLGFWFSAEVYADEGYYWVWGQRPDWSYFDHPPMLAWVQGLFASLFGQSIAVLRLPNLLTTIATFYLYYLFIKRLYPDSRRQIFVATALTLISSPMLFTFMSHAIMDHLLIVLLLGSAYLMVFYLEDVAAGQRPPLWRLYVGAALLGLAGITKYSAVFLAAGIGLTILLHARLRPMLRQPHIYLAAGITLLMFSPVIAWNIENDFASFAYHLVDRNPGSDSLRFKPDAFFGFILGSIIVLSPFTFWLAVRRFILDGNRQPSRWFNLSSHSVYGSVALMTFVVCTGLFLSRSLFAHTLLYWNIPAYLLLLPMLGKALLDEDGRLRSKKLFVGQQVYGVLLASLVAFNTAVLPLDTWTRKGRGDQGARHWYGWQQTARVIEAELQKPGLSDPLLLTTDHHLAGALSFTMNRTDFVAIARRRDQYDIWWDDSGYLGRDALVVFDEWRGMDDGVSSLFERTGDVIEVPISKYGYPIKTMYIQKFYGYRGKPGSK